LRIDSTQSTPMPPPPARTLDSDRAAAPARTPPARPFRLGQHIHETRLSQGLALHQVERACKIRWEFLQAIELNANSPGPRQAYGILLTELGRHDEAEAQLRKALEVDPLSVVGNWIYSFCLFLSRRYDKAIKRAERTLELDPNFGVAHLSLAFAYQMKGEHEKSVESYALCSEVMGFPENAGYVRESFKAGWDAFLRSMTMSSANRPMMFSSYIVAVFFAMLGDADGALAELEAAFAKRESHLTMLKADPRFDGLRDDPRFDELLDRIGFPK